MNQQLAERDRRLDTEPDFIMLRRFGFSMDKLMIRYDVVPDETIALALAIPLDEVAVRYNDIVGRLRTQLVPG